MIYITFDKIDFNCPYCEKYYKDDEDVYEVNKRDYYACIVGKAYYEGRINLKEVIENAG